MKIPQMELEDPQQVPLFVTEPSAPPPSNERHRRPSARTMPHDAFFSPTLEQLDAARRPKAGTVCERCPNSVWFASPAEVKCYCRVMFLLTWSSLEPQQLISCDGVLLG